MNKQPNFSPLDLERYARHLVLPEVGLKGQEKLQAARVLCVGAGGLGAPVLLYLAAAGVGTIGIVDPDVVSLSNLQRQVLYETATIGKAKIAEAERKLIALNPNTRVITYPEKLIKENAIKLIGDYDIVIDASDNYATRYVVSDACYELKKPHVYGSVFQFEGQCAFFFPSGNQDTPCYRCLYPKPPLPNLLPSSVISGIMGVLPAVIGSLQATEVLKYFLQIGTPLMGRLLVYDALKMSFNEYKITKNGQCSLCGGEVNKEVKSEK